MSLFEDNRYQWRETYFVLFHSEDRPPADKVNSELAKLGSRFAISEVRTDDDGQFESVTMFSSHDCAAMDITYISGEEVTEQVAEFAAEMKNATLTREEMGKIAKITECDARFDVYHFEEVSDNEDDILDPGALLIVMECLTGLCGGVGIDPQAGSVM